jgi:hypothetical protein
VDLWSTSLVGNPGTSVMDDPSFVPQVSAVWARDYASSSPSSTPESTIEYPTIN